MLPYKDVYMRKRIYIYHHMQRHDSFEKNPDFREYDEQQKAYYSILSSMESRSKLWQVNQIFKI